MQYSWRKYYEKTKNNPPRPLLVKALTHVSDRGSALDVGAGALVDSRYLLEEGFTAVTAFDVDETSRELAAAISDERFFFYKQSFTEFQYVKEAYDLVTGQYAFSFMSVKDFDQVFQQILDSIKVGGIVTGNIFGDRDGWNNGDGTKTFLTKEDCQLLFSDWEILLFNEVERDDETALGVPKHWHEFEIIARKQ